jgi:hypothetical protein
MNQWYAFVMDRFGTIHRLDVPGTHFSSDIAQIALLDGRPWLHRTEVVCLCTLKFYALAVDGQLSLALSGEPC